MSPTHPLWQPYEPPTDEEIAQARVVPAGRSPGGGRPTGPWLGR